MLGFQPGRKCRAREEIELSVCVFCVCVWFCLCVCVCVHACIQVHIRACMCAYTYVCMQSYSCMSVCHDVYLWILSLWLQFTAENNVPVALPAWYWTDFMNKNCGLFWLSIFLLTCWLCCITNTIFCDRLTGLVVKASTSGVEDLLFESHLWQDFSGLSHTSDLKMGTPVATLPSAWHYRVSAGTGQLGVSILWPDEVESLICNFCLSVAAHNIVWADPSLYILTCCWDIKQPTNKQSFFFASWT